MDFVSHDALVAAMQDWLRAKHHSLADLLVDRGALDAGTRSLLDALVNLHVERHAGDARRSLAALGPLGPARQDLEVVGDAEVRASLSQIGTTLQADDAVAATRPHAGAPT